jgi:hypothetical protein
MSLFTSAEIVVSSFISRVSSVDSLQESDLTKNLIVTISTSALLVIAFVGILYFLIQDSAELRRIAKLDRKRFKPVRTNIQQLFEELLPIEFTNGCVCLLRIRKGSILRQPSGFWQLVKC